MNYHMYRIFVLCLFFLLHALGEESELILLNDDNFEHLTQAATGATTGDWLVFMVKSGVKCSECADIEKELKNVAEEMNNRLNVAKLDTEASRITLRRFKIQKKPTIMFFRLGYQWIYNKRMSSQEIRKFVTEGYVKQNAYPVAKQLDRFDVWQEDYVKEMKAAIKERRLPERNALLVTLAALVVGLILLSCVFPSKPKVTAKEQGKQKRK